MQYLHEQHRLNKEFIKREQDKQLHAFSNVITAFTVNRADIRL